MLLRKGFIKVLLHNIISQMNIIIKYKIVILQTGYFTGIILSFDEERDHRLEEKRNAIVK